jgi:hypothetical protein
MASRNKGSQIIRNISDYWLYASRLAATGSHSKMVFTHRPPALGGPQTLPVTKSGGKN